MNEKLSSDAIHHNDTRLCEIHIRGWIKRAHVQKLKVEEVKLLAAGGRILRAAMKATSKLESDGGSVVLRFYRSYMR